MPDGLAGVASRKSWTNVIVYYLYIVYIQYTSLLIVLPLKSMALLCWVSVDSVNVVGHIWNVYRIGLSEEKELYPDVPFWS